MKDIRLPELKVALVHDWLTGMRGGEKVLEVFCELFPQADLFTLIHNPGSVSPLIENRKIHTSFINRLPLKKTHYRHYLPLFPTAIELFNFKNYDVIISTSHCVAKGVLTPPNVLHISYLHTPMRYVWDMYEEYFGKDKINWWQRWIIPFFANYLRMWDVSSSNRVDYFLANSRHV
ncbi:MAG: glycosyltransferase family 4 protein, partial [Calditrichaeota bacterium]